MRLRLWIISAVCVWPVLGGADTIKLANGDTLNGEIIEWAVDHLVIDHPQLGRIELALDELELDSAERPSRGLFDTGFLRGWKRSFNFGWNGKMGNTDSLNVTASLNFGYLDDWTRWKLTGRYFYNQSDDGDEDNDNNARIDLRRDWLVPDSRWFGFLSARYQFDQFESWQHRINLGGGPGLHVIQHETHMVDVLFGPNLNREFGTRNTTSAELLGGLDYIWKITSSHSFSLSNQAFVTIGPDPGDLRNVTIGALRFLLTESPKLNLTLGVENEYETNPDEGDDPNTLNYYFTMGVDF